MPTSVGFFESAWALGRHGFGLVPWIGGGEVSGEVFLCSLGGGLRADVVGAARGKGRKNINRGFDIV